MLLIYVYINYLYKYLIKNKIEVDTNINIESIIRHFYQVEPIFIDAGSICAIFINLPYSNGTSKFIYY